MIHLTFAEAAAACGGRLVGMKDMDEKHVENVAVAKICVDSREVTAGSLFIALKGERVDGHYYIPTAVARGALCVVSDKTVPYCHIRVENTLAAMQKLAAYIRKKSGVTVVAVTGSVGKTTTRQMVSCVLKQKYNVLSTDGNFNNEYGLPRTIFRLEADNEIAVLEMGISHFGEMDRLGAIAKPDYAVFTNIARMHLENLIDRDGVLRAKTELIAHMNPNGRLFFNGLDDKLRSYRCDVPITYYGMTDEYAVYPAKIEPHGVEYTDLTLHFPERALQCRLPVVGQQLVLDAIAAATVGMAFKLTPEQIVAGLESYTPVGRRGRVVSAGEFTIVDDCYNAGPDSVRAAIAALPKEGNRAALLGDMLELGEKSAELHYSLGRYCAEAGLNLLFTSGEGAKEIARGAVDAGMKAERVLCITPETAAEIIVPRMNKGDVLLVKASRGMKFERIIDSIMANINTVKEERSKLIVASNNANKIKEIREILSSEFDTIISMREAGINPDVDEDADSFMGNARKKAEECAKLLPGCNVLADDSGLCVDVLNGAPGVYSARYAGQVCDDAANRKKLLDALEGIPFEKRGAHFGCAMVLIRPNGEEVSAYGTVEGKILFEEQGENGFGYDSIFFYEPMNISFAQMDSQSKNDVSHRKNALKQLLAALGEKR